MAIGIHVEGNSAGYSRDAAVQSARQIGGKFATVVNDPTLCMMLLDVDITPIHRISRNGLIDDNQQQYNNTREYIRTAHTEVPDKRALLYWNNEPGQQDLTRLRDEGLIAIDEANKLGRTLCILNWSYGNPEPGAWDILAPLAQAAARGGHYVGFHEGTDKAHPTLASCYPDLIGRFLVAQKRFGFKVLVTEFAASLDAWNGWQTWTTAQAYAKVCEDTVREVYAPNGVHMTPFTLFPWHTGFDYVNSPELKQAWASINAKYPVKDQPMANPWDSHNFGTRTDGATMRATTGIKVRETPSETSTVHGLLSDGSVVTYWATPYPGENYRWYRVLFEGVQRYIADVSSLRFEGGTPTTPTVQGRLITPAAEQRIRAHSKSIDDANAAIRAELDSAPVVAPDDGIPF